MPKAHSRRGNSVQNPGRQRGDCGSAGDDTPPHRPASTTSRRRHVSVFVGLAIAAAVVYSPLFDLRPFRGDNVYVLAWVDQASLSSFLSLDPAIYPEWRPLAYVTVWLEYRLFGLAGMPVHIFINVMLWAACAWLVYLIVDQLTGAFAAATLVAVWLLFDYRATEALALIVERQSSLACLAGLTAILMLARARHRPLSPLEASGLAGLLFTAALSKEYGLAFAAAVVAYGALSRARQVVVSATAAVASYVAARAALADIGLRSYCEVMGYFDAMSFQCVDWSIPGVRQMLYNIAASVVGTAVPGVLTNEGSIGIARSQVAGGLGMLALSAIGLRCGGPIVRAVAVVPLANALLGFLLYRHRNQLVGVCAIAIMAGAGIHLWPRLAERARFVPSPRGALAVILTLLLVRAGYAHTRAVAVLNDTRHEEPCESIAVDRPFGKDFVRRLKEHYRLADPACLVPPKPDPS